MKSETCLTASNIFSFAVMAAAAIAEAVGMDDGATDIWSTFGGVTHYRQTQSTEHFLNSKVSAMFSDQAPPL